MVKFEDFQVYGKEHFDAAVASAGTFTKGLQAIAAAVSDYSKKSFEDGSAFVEKLLEREVARQGNRGADRLREVGL